MAGDGASERPKRRQAEVSRPPLQMDAAMPALFALPPPDPGFEIVVSQPGMSQGLAQTEGIQVFPRAYVQLGLVRIGAQWRNVDSPAFAGVAAVFVTVGRKVGEVQLDGAVRYRIRTGVKGPADSEAWELGLGARRNFGNVGLRLNAEYSPNDFADGQSLYFEVAPSFDVDKATKMSASIGRRARNDESDYTSFNAGISRVLAQNIFRNVSDARGSKCLPACSRI